MMREDIVSPVGLVAAEIVRIAPILAYFLVVGLVFGRMAGAATGARWAMLAAGTAMVIEVLLESQYFYAGIDVLAATILAVSYLLPIAFAVAGALAMLLWERRLARS
jgi:hypothetical protein